MMILDQAQSKRGFLSAGFFINLGLLIVGIYLSYVISDYPDMARAFPRLVLVMILAVTAVDTILMIRKGRGDESLQEETEGSGPGRTMKVLYMVALMFLFYLLLNLFGLIVAVLLFLLFSGWTLGYKKPRRLIISSVIITAFVYLIFQVVMNSILPDPIILGLIGG